MTASRDPVATQTVLITGATDGLGRATALLLAQEGYRVFAAGRSAEKRASLDREAAQQNLSLETLEMDVADDGSARRGVARVLEHAGSIDVLVNNAGVGYIAVMEEVRMEDLRRQFEVNFFGAVRLIQAVLPEMRVRRRGRIINMSSISGKIATPLFGPYSSSKFALEAMSDALRMELRPFGIHVVLIEPGYIRTGFENASVDLSSAYAARAEKSPYAAIYSGFRRAWKRTTRPPSGAKPKKPATTPEDCARVVLRALRDTPPRPRYTVTRAAWMGSLAKRLLPDAFLDRRILRSMGIEGTIDKLAGPESGSGS
jgi:NAD(P)-dependent dehydrogenase (short-subunit alcohol dehydrogenase family)